MQRAPRIPELTQSSRFVRQAVAAGVAYAASDGVRLADVASPAHARGRTTLLWTVHGEAERWADVLVAGARVVPLSLSDLAVRVLPGLHRVEHFVGLDWSAEPIEPEVEPMDLLGRLQARALDCFVASLKTSRSLWIVEDAAGPVVAGSLARPGEVVLPCFTSREEAGRQMAGLVAGAELTEIGLDNFVAETIPWLADRGWLLSPGTWGGQGGPEVGANEVAARLAGGLAAA